MASSSRRLLARSSLIGFVSATVVGLVGPHCYSDHQGLMLVGVNDRVDASSNITRPRHTYVVVFDGLGFEEGSRMSSIHALSERGQCLKTDVGPFPVSRPVYAVLSTGLEQDRTGVRSNAITDPLHVESIWQVAREAGLMVSATSDLGWWRELFPGGFSSYQVLPDSDDYFTQAAPADFVLIHPVYVDATGHAFGAGSAEYRAAVERADQELGRFLKTVDFTRDLVVVTADHGHSLRGGHGGLEDRVAHVVTCYAGVGVGHLMGMGSMPMTDLAPSLAVLTGLRFPREMRAGDDHLDVLWQLANLPPTYLKGRQEAVAAFRRANKEAYPSGWRALYAWRRRLQHVGLALLSIAALLAALVVMKAGRSWGNAFIGLAWSVAFCAVAVTSHVFIKGGFDWTSTNGHFIATTVTLAAAVFVVFAFARRPSRRVALMADLAGLIALGTVLMLGHIALYGWLVRVPMAEPAFVLMPYFGSLTLGVVSGLGLLIGWFPLRKQLQLGPRA